MLVEIHNLMARLASMTDECLLLHSFEGIDLMEVLKGPLPAQVALSWLVEIRDLGL